MTTASSSTQGEGSDLLQALDFVQNYFDRWHQQGTLRGEPYEELRRYYGGLRDRLQADPAAAADLNLRPPGVCWSCRASLDRPEKACVRCGAPLHGPEVRTLRYLVFLCHEIKKHETEGRLDLAAVHDCLAEANGHIRALRNRLDRERIPMAEPVPQPPARASAPAAPTAPAAPAPRRNLLEILLDPKSIQWLLASGGALLVLGLFIWLAAQGVFQNKVVVASLLAAANAALLVGGWAVLRLTRHQTAGRAITLLACLVMPLNLWFYDAQGLITLEQHLWVPALACCVLYAVSAHVVRDPTFVYVLVGGVTMTGLLMLGDINKFREISAPATLLVLLGLLSLHAERAFPEGEGPFARRRFGLAFFWSGQVLLAAGLLLVLGAQLCGDWLYPAFSSLYRSAGFHRPEIVTTMAGRLLALGLVLAATYAYAYSDLVVRRVGVYIYAAVFTLLWAEVLLIGLLPLTRQAEAIILALAVTALAVNLALAYLTRANPVLTRLGPPLALFLALTPAVFGVVLHCRATTAFFPGFSYQLSPLYVVAMLATAVSCRLGAYLYRHDRPALSVTYFFGTAAATLVGAAGLLRLVGPAQMPWEDQAPALMIIPLAYLVAARLYRGHTPERPLVWVAQAATAVMLVSSLGTAFRGFAAVQNDALNLLLALFFAEAALFYGLAAAWRNREANVYAATATACVAVWQVLKFYTVRDEYYILAFAVVGVLLLIAYRLALLERLNRAGLARAAFQCGNALLSLAFGAGALMTLTELLTGHGVRGVLVTLLFVLAAGSLLAVALVRQQAWRRWYVVTAVVDATLVVLVLAVLGRLTVGEKLEIVSVVSGLLLLVVGHVGWYREQERHNDLVSLCLGLGSLLVALPLIVAVVGCRLAPPYFDTFHTLNELGMLAAGLLLLATGYMFRIKSTALGGTSLMATYLVTLLLFIRFPAELQTTAVYMMTGGALFFAAGLLLSLYRDRLLQLPDRIKRREGVFRVLTWR